MSVHWLTGRAMCGVCDVCSTKAELATANEELHLVRRAKLQQLYTAEREQSAQLTTWQVHTTAVWRVTVISW